MRGSFFEFNNAVSGLFLSKAALNVTAHNIANASVRGYSRQYAEMRANPALSTNSIKGMVPTGAEFYGIGQYRDFYLDKKYWTYESTLGEYGVKRQQLALTQTIFNEFSETGLKTQLNDFETRLQDLVTNAGDPTYRTNVIQQGDALATYIRSTYENLQKQQRDINSEIAATVQTINSLGRQISSLNKQITLAEYTGDRANDLRDQRARIIDELGKYVNVTVEEKETNEDYAKGMYPEPEDRIKSHKVLKIQINGQDFINGFDINPLECRERRDTSNGSVAQLYVNPEDVTGLYDVYFANSEFKFDVYSPRLSGVLKGLIDLRDGNNGNYAEASTISQTIPSYSVKFKGTPSAADILAAMTAAGITDAYTSAAYGTGKDAYTIVTVANNTLNLTQLDAATAALANPAPGVTAKGSVSKDIVLEFDANVSRLDIKEDGGVLTFVSDASGIKQEFRYTGAKVTYLYNDPNDPNIITGASVEFTMSVDTPVPSKFLDDTKYTASIGQTTDYKGIPYYLEKINELVRTLANGFNEGRDLLGKKMLEMDGHANGYDANNNDWATLFFTYKDASVVNGKTVYLDAVSQRDNTGTAPGQPLNPFHADNPVFNVFKLNALNLAVNGDLKNNPAYMVAATYEQANKPVGGSVPNNTGISENGAVYSYINLLNDKTLFREGTIGDYVIGIAGELGIDAAQAKRFENNYNDVVASVDYQRMSVSGVELNEEMTDMIRFQQQYHAAARLVSAIDKVYDTLINRLGAF